MYKYDISKNRLLRGNKINLNLIFQFFWCTETKHEEKEKENHHINGWKKIHSHIITFREIEKSFVSNKITVIKNSYCHPILIEINQHL